MVSTSQFIDEDLLQRQRHEIEKERLSESLRYQIDELERAGLKAGEYDSLCAKRDLLRNAEKLTESLDAAMALLGGEEESAVSLAQNAAYHVSRAAAFAAELEDTAETIKAAAFNLSDAGELLKDLRESLDFSPGEYDALETRVSLLGKLQRKYSRDEDGLIAHLEQCRERLDSIQYADERSAKLKKQLADAHVRCGQEAQALSTARKTAAAQLEQRILGELRALNMPSVRFEVEFSPLEGEPGFDAHGCDRIRFLMSANAGEEPGRISRIASGGELSRIMLAMKNVFAEKDPVGTMVFDEIDTGVSGVAAQRVGEKLLSVSLGKQVMCVTHLPQIAAMADQHYLIRKEEHGGRTYTEVLALDREGRRREIARLHGGDNISELTLASAEEQLAACDRFKHELAGQG